MGLNVPNALRTWFIIHFIVDVTFGIPLLFFPSQTLGLLGFPTAELLTARLVGAALIGIGGTSFLVRNESEQSFLALLKLKVVWSLSAIVGILITLYESAPTFTWLVLGIFVVFSGVWWYYFLTLMRS